MRKIRGLWKLLFGRTTILILMLLVQVVALVGGFVLLDKYVFIFNYLLGFISLIILLYILNARQNSSFKITWIILILFAPFFGVIFYLFTRVQPGTRFIGIRIEAALEEQAPYLAQDPYVLEALEEEAPEAAGLARYIHDSGKYPTYRNTQIRYFSSGEEKFEEMVRQLREAKEFIFLEYFIVDKGVMWDTVLEILEQKVKEGVEVRFMYDGTCSLSLLPPNYPRKMKALGIQCKVFAPITPFLSTHQNNRDHRKVLVIDGHTAFTGGVNLADEYINKVKRFGYWKDTGVRIEGEAVWNLTAMFLEMWNYINRSTEDYSRFLPSVYREKEFTSDGFVQPYGDSPLDNENVGENIYLNIINRAKNYVYIFTPYLIIDHEMLICLSNAAKSGVDVRIVTPGVPDKKAVYLLTQSYYEPLLKNGVKIFQYTPGFIHAKCFVCDDEIATVGSVNLDYRSLFLHFECGVFMYRSKAVMQVKEDCLRTFEESEEMDVSFCRRRRLPVRMVQSLMRLFAPLL